MRRLHRGGEGQYLVNRSPVRRTDLVELLADVGLGGSMGSIISQGRVEEILGSKPEERRQLVEEAAGLGTLQAPAPPGRAEARARRGRRRAGARPRGRGQEAAAAARAPGDGCGAGREAARGDRCRTGADRAAGVGRRRGAARRPRRSAARLRRSRAIARGRSWRRCSASATGSRASSSERPEVARRRRLRGTGSRARPSGSSTGARARRPWLGRLRADPPQVRSAERERLLEEARLGRERLGALERALAELEGLPPAARALAERGETLVLSSLDVDQGDERAVAAALGWRAAAVVADDAQTALDFLEQARAAGLGNLGVVIGGAKPEAPIVEKDELLRSTELSVTREGFAFDPARGELWYAGEAAEAVLLELEARRRSLEAEIAELDAAAERAATQAPATDPRPAELAERLTAALTDCVRLAARFEPSLDARADARGQRAKELGEELRELGAKEAELRRAASEAGERSSGIEVELATLAAEAQRARAPHAGSRR